MNTVECKIEELNKKHLPHIQRILIRNAHHITSFRPATKQEDVSECFDALISFDNARIAIRIREYQDNDYAKRFLDFTIRSRSKCGLKTEYDKILEGFGDYFFYAWENEQHKLGKYLIADLDIFRKEHAHTHKNHIPNNDGTAFYAYPLLELQKTGCVKIFECLNY